MRARMIPYLLQMILLITFLILLVHLCGTLNGYDCETLFGTGTTVSLLKADACGFHGGAPVLRDAYVELLHHPRFTNVNILSFRIEIDHIVNDSDYKNIHARYKISNKRHYLLISTSACTYLHVYGELQFGNSSFRNLSADGVNSRSIPLN